MDEQQHLKSLSEIPLFQDLDNDELGSLNSYLSEIEVNKDEVVFNEDDAGEFVCFVVDGTLDVIKKTLTGKSESIALLSKGRSIGEMALVDSLRRSATIRARTDASLTVLTRKEFDRLQEDQPQIAIKILKHMARTLSLNLRRTSNLLSDSIELPH
jgi:CRP-like cAMP-binding protein